MDERAGPVAALDCGTNSTRLLVVGTDGTVLERLMRITRLGEGVDATHRLSPEAVARTVSVLTDYRTVMDRHGVVRARLVATSAARDATNAEEFLSASLDVTGVPPEILTGLEEGALSFAGATAHVPHEALGPGPVLVVDIGGGSTELVAGELVASELAPSGPRGAPASVAAVSLDVGCVRVTERFLHHDPPWPDELSRARRTVDAQLARARAELPPLAPGGLLIGLAGTVSTLAALDQRLARYQREAVHHLVLGRDKVAHWLETLVAEDSRARLARPGMVEGRADVIAGGVLILDAVMDGFDRDACLVSEDDILDGLAATLL
ncbi:MAG TPA: Ppx/GppA phosphatase family protein [Acidimicrobiales bacterium]|nr:Ppx/GppA phosphatase family protein [Acidimicrobiales bacterium]